MTTSPGPSLAVKNLFIAVLALLGLGVATVSLFISHTVFSIILFVIGTASLSSAWFTGKGWE